MMFEASKSGKKAESQVMGGNIIRFKHQDNRSQVMAKVIDGQNGGLEHLSNERRRWLLIRAGCIVGRVSSSWAMLLEAKAHGLGCFQE